MLRVLANSWALLLGLGLLMVGNGMLSTLMGVRGSIEEFTAFELSAVTSAYFAGFLGGSRLAPGMIRRVGHVRVFAALASFISAALILFPVATDPVLWIALRIVVGFCFSGVYVTTESWLNDGATNETRGQTLSAYMIVQMMGIVVGQAVFAAGDPGGFILFIIPSVLVSISFAPILLSISPTPAFTATKPMSLRELFDASPLAFVSMAILGGVFAAMFGMAAVYAAESGLSNAQVSTFIASIFVGSVATQFPIGLISDRMDRRQLIFATAVVGGIAGVLGAGVEGVAASESRFSMLLALGFVLGGTASPLYSLIIAYLNDHLEPEDMASASGGLIFINGLGAVGGPLLTGGLMAAVGPSGFWVYVAVLMLMITVYSLYRMTQRSATPADETGVYVSIMPTATPVAVEAAQEWAVEHADDPDSHSGLVGNQ